MRYDYDDYEEDEDYKLQKRNETKAFLAKRNVISNIIKKHGFVEANQSLSFSWDSIKYKYDNEDMIYFKYVGEGYELQIAYDAREKKNYFNMKFNNIYKFENPKSVLTNVEKVIKDIDTLYSKK